VFLTGNTARPGAFPLSVFYPLHRYTATNGTFIGVFEHFCRYMGFKASATPLHLLPHPVCRHKMDAPVRIFSPENCGYRYSVDGGSLSIPQE
jgi:hypothetical protein